MNIVFLRIVNQSQRKSAAGLALARRRRELSVAFRLKKIGLLCLATNKHIFFLRGAGETGCILPSTKGIVSRQR